MFVLDVLLDLKCFILCSCHEEGVPLSDDEEDDGDDGLVKVYLGDLNNKCNSFLYLFCAYLFIEKKQRQRNVA